jgi:hypothetical protein
MSLYRLATNLIVVSALVLAALILAGCGGQPTSVGSEQPTSLPSPTETPASAGESAADTPSEEETGPAAGGDMESQASESGVADETVASPGTASLKMVPNEEENALEVWVEDVSQFYALDVEIRFDASRFQVADADPDKEGVQIRPGEAPRPDFVAQNSVDNEAGVIHYVATQLGTDSAFSGSGLVATIVWQDEGVAQQDISAQGETVSFGTVTLVNQDIETIGVNLK